MGVLANTNEACYGWEISLLKHSSGIGNPGTGNYSYCEHGKEGTGKLSFTNIAYVWEICLY